MLCRGLFMLIVTELADTERFCALYDRFVSDSIDLFVRGIADMYVQQCIWHDRIVKPVRVGSCNVYVLI